MNYTKYPEQPTRFEKVGESLISFRLGNLFVSDNKFLFIAPQKDFCKTCFQRRYHSQIDGASVDQIADSVLSLARGLDTGFKESRVWRWFLVDSEKVGKPFELTPYEDCPVCGKEKLHNRDQATVHYEHLMNQESIPRLDALINQVFSFGFARGLVSDNRIGVITPAFNKIKGKLKQILGDSHHARIIYRMITPDGRHADDTSTGFAPDKDLAELKSVMEYMERYAFMLRTCRLKTKEFDDQIIGEYLSLYYDAINNSERNHIRSGACWGVNLSTKEICAIPQSFIFNDGQLRFIQPTTNGFAAHIDFRKSLCSSIFELVERDAFIRFWYDPQRAYNFVPDVEVTAAIGNIITALKPVVGNNELVSNCFIVKSPTRLPVVMATISSQNFLRPPALCFGYGAGFDIQEALSGALKELRINASNLVKAVTLFDGYMERKFTSKIESAPDRMNFYSTSAPRAKLGFLDDKNPLVEGIVENAERDSLNAITERFRQAGLDIYGIDFTPDCFKDKNVFVTRAFSPGLYPLQFRLESAFNLPSGPMSVHKELPHFFL